MYVERQLYTDKNRGDIGQMKKDLRKNYLHPTFKDYFLSQLFKLRQGNIYMDESICKLVELIVQ